MKEDGKRAESTSLQQLNSRENELRSEIFTIYVGAERHRFTAHQDVLSKSPKFSAQCDSERFAEGKSKTIELLDDDPTIFTLLLEYLYKGDYWPLKGEELSAYPSADEGIRASQTQREAELYTVAGYCQLLGLQQVAVEKMKSLKPLALESFLTISKSIYDHNRGTGAYREYFREELKQHLGTAVAEPWVMKQIDQGGELALDIFSADRAGRIAGIPNKGKNPHHIGEFCID